MIWDSFFGYPYGYSIVALVLFAFQIWMFIDAVRREEYLWAIFLFFFGTISAVLYFFLVYRPAGGGFPSMRGFELPGAADRRRIKKLQDEIYHLDRAHSHLELGDIYFNQGKLDKAEVSYRAALERDSEDLDIKAHLGQCLLRRGNAKEALPLLDAVIAQDPKHDYGYTQMALAESLAALGKTDAALERFRGILKFHSYSRARMQCAELYFKLGRKDEARKLVEELLADVPHMPPFQRKRDSEWIRKARHLQSKL
jgi:hypothetical protein